VMNAMAGGGTILTFPSLIFLGLPAITANATSTVALLPAAVASETVATSQASLWANAMATFKPAVAGGGGAVLDPGFYYFNGSGFAGGGGICLNGGELLARDVTVEFVNAAGFSSGNCVLGGAAVCAVASCQFGSDPAGGKVDTNYSWFAAPCSQDPTASPDASCLGGSSWCPAGDRSCSCTAGPTPSGSGATRCRPSPRPGSG